MTAERQVVVISGGSRGLGAALVQYLLADGHAVATFSRSSSSFIEDQRNNDPDGTSFFWSPVDGLAFNAVDRFVMDVTQHFGRIDALVNNAGMLIEGLLPLIRPEDIHRIISLNVEGTIRLTRACSRAMIRQQRGVIVNISSLNGIRGARGVSVYSATKAALDGLTRSLARELGPRGIRVNSVAPGYFESEMTATIGDEHAKRIRRRTPLRRFGTAADMAKVVRFLISSDASFVTGQTIVVDGGLTC